MYFVIIGIINNIVWLIYISGALLSQKNREIIAFATHFLHKYFYWYFDFRIAHILSVLAIICSIISLHNGKTSLGLFFVGLILNILWICIYTVAYMN